MTFKDFVEKFDPYGAHLPWITVEEAKERGSLPEKYHEAFDNLCECGSENIITASLTQITCCDPYCPIKQGYKLAELMSKFGIDGLGPATCCKVYDVLTFQDKKEKEQGGEGFLHTNSHLEMLLVPFDKYPIALRTAAGELFYESACKIRSIPITFPKLIGMLGLKGFGGNSEVLFKNLNSYEQLRAEIIAKGGIREFLCSRGSYSNMGACNLKVALPDIHIADFIFGGCIRQSGLQMLDISITGNIKFRGNSITKANFIKMCNNLCITSDGVQLYEVRMTSALEHNAFILYSVPSTSAKFIKGQSRGVVTDDFGTHSVLMTVDDFYSLLERKMQEWETNIQNSKMKQMTLQTTSTPEAEPDSQTTLLMTSF